MIPLIDRRILLFGSQKIAIDIINLIKKRKFCGMDMETYVYPELVGVITSDEERDRQGDNQLVSEYCFQQGIPSFCFEGKINTEIIKKMKPDIIFSVYYRKMIPKDVLSIPHMGCVNLHPSLLPKDRGPNPVYWCIRRGDKITGTTLHYMDEGMDTGDIIDQRQVRINNMAGFRLGEQLMKSGVDLFRSNYADIMCGKNDRMEQDSTYIAPTCNILFNDLMRKINWTESAESIINHIRAHTRPYSGSIAENKNGGQTFLWKAEILHELRGNKGPGSYEIRNGDLIVQTYNSPIRVKDYTGEIKPKGRFV